MMITVAQYAHMIFNNGGVFDLSTNNIVRVKVYVPTLIPHTTTRQLSLKLQDGTSSAPWETQRLLNLTFDAGTRL